MIENRSARVMQSMGHKWIRLHRSARCLRMSPKWNWYPAYGMWQENSQISPCFFPLPAGDSVIITTILRFGLSVLRKRAGLDSN